MNVLVVTVLGKGRTIKILVRVDLVSGVMLINWIKNIEMEFLFTSLSKRQDFVPTSCWIRIENENTINASTLKCAMHKHKTDLRVDQEKREEQKW